MASSTCACTLAPCQLVSVFVCTCALRLVFVSVCECVCVCVCLGEIEGLSVFVYALGADTACVAMYVRWCVREFAREYECDIACLCVCVCVCVCVCLHELECAYV